MEHVNTMQASIQVVADDSNNTQGTQEDDWTNDDLSKVKGPEKRGYVRCVGKMLSRRNNGASSSTSSQTVEQRLAQTEDVLYTLVNLLKDPTRNSNLSDVLRIMNIEVYIFIHIFYSYCTSCSNYNFPIFIGS